MRCSSRTDTERIWSSSEIRTRDLAERNLISLRGEFKVLDFSSSHKLYFVMLNYSSRFDSTPESGETKGLLLILDAHSDLVTSSSVTEAYRVCHF